MVDVVTFFIMLFGLGISFWNAYATGYNSVILQYYKGKFKEFFTIANSFSLVLAFAGAAYYLSYFIAYIMAYLGKISYDVVMLISAYSFVVFGTLLVFTGVVIAIESILIAYLRRDFWSIFVAIYNSLVSILNLYTYFNAIGDAYNLIKGSGDDEDSKNKALMIVLLSAIISIILVYLFYKKGKEKAEKEISHVKGAKAL
ncbi:MAG: hypothetical protein GXN99_01375 [Candidatus Nanohaloarchaeota archaeon]|nr:hypothetical protein [Candidatus Nanohaloarchaeota archaeon]